MEAQKIKRQDDDDHSTIDKIYFYDKDQNEAKHQYLIKTREKMVLKIWKIQKFSWIFK